MLLKSDLVRIRSEKDPLIILTWKSLINFPEKRPLIFTLMMMSEEILSAFCSPMFSLGKRDRI